MATLARTTALLLWLLAMAVTPSTLLAQVDAYSVEVAVADRSDVERRSAYASALRNVLLANSPDKTLMNRDEVRIAVSDAEAYVQTYSYRVPEPGTPIPVDTPLTDQVRASGEATALLLVRFDRERVLDLISGREEASRIDTAADEADERAPDPFGGASTALVWLLIDEGSRTIRGSDADAGKVRERLRELAGGAGVSLVFPQIGPQAGITAESLLSGQAIRELDPEAVREASLRQRVDVVLVGHLSRREAFDALAPSQNAAIEGAAARESGAGDTDADSRVRRAPGIGRMARNVDTGWQGAWMRLADSAQERTTTEAERLDDVLAAGVAWLVNDPALGKPAGYAYGGQGSDTEALVRFVGVTSLETYAAVLELLESLPGVATVYPKEAAGDEMTFAILPRSSLASLGAAARTTDWLRRAVAPSGGAVSDLARNAELTFDVLR